MSSRLNAYSRAKHQAVKHLSHKLKEIYVSTDEIYEANGRYGVGDYWKYVRDQFREKHGVEITDTERLVLYHTLDDKILKIAGHIGFSLTEPHE